MSGFVGGKLKLKGGDPKGVTKKKKKKSTGSEAALALATAGSGEAGTAEAAEGAQAAAAAEPVKTKDGYILPAPSAAQDRRTEAQKRHDERLRKLEEERLRKMATKGYRDRVKDFNEHLASLSEHHDIPKVSAALARAGCCWCGVVDCSSVSCRWPIGGRLRVSSPGVCCLPALELLDMLAALCCICQ
jgi:protein FAM32A